MDRKWMSMNRLTEEYKAGGNDFIKFALENSKNSSTILCPCTKYYNTARLSVNELKNHLITRGIDQTYTRWIWHGEKEEATINVDDMYTSQGDRLEEMAQAVEDNYVDRPKILEKLLSDAREPLYPSCSKFTKLSAILKLYNLKASHGWTDRGFTALLELLIEMLPEDNVLPNCTYEAKKTIRSLGMDYERIHACPNDCILYRKEYESLDCCPNTHCGAARYKRDGVPAKVVWYFPIIPRFKRLFSNAEDAEKLRWHDKGKSTDGKLRHPVDSPQWKTIDHIFPDFSRDPRNLRLALSSDGINPFSHQSSTHSTWPVVLVLYNLHPSLCMSRKYMMLSLLISGSKQPDNDIDVYLEPLIDDLKLMWSEGVEVFDASLREKFSLRAMLFCTINDFPAYGNLSGYSVKGHEACPICQSDTDYLWLKHCKKTVYQGHRRFLTANHRYRKLRKAFNNNSEHGKAPQRLSGQQILAIVKELNIIYGKKRQVPLSSRGWKKKSVFFTLPYWEHLYVRHCLDVMHIEKNVCESLIGTLLNVKGKSKDGINARLDMQDMGIRTELSPQEGEKRTYLPPACYTLSKKEKVAFCKFFLEVKVPSGFSSNVRSLINMNELRFQGMKSHDCHIFIQELLPIAIRGILPKHVRHVVIRLCFFFKKICNKVIDPEGLEDLQVEIVVTLCQLEMYFPPSFFDIMVHLTVHLVEEIRYCGPVYLRWMYPFERYMKVLKGFVKNRYRPEASIVERYIIEEAVEFCNEYLSEVDRIGLPKFVQTEPDDGKGTVGGNLEEITPNMRHQAHLYVLHNSQEVEDYVVEHMSCIRSQCLTHKSEKWVADEHNRLFSGWLRNRILNKMKESPESVSTVLKWLSQEPLYLVKTYTAYEINGCTFYTKEHDDKSTTQNSGVMVVAEGVDAASIRHTNPGYTSTPYYGVIEHIWELDYTHLKIPVFCCRWVDTTYGVRMDDLGFIQVDLRKVGHKNDSFILASQAKQVFYVPDPSDRKWSIVLKTKEKHVDEDNDKEDEFNSSLLIPSVDTDVNEDVSYLRDDHEEGIWINGDNSSSQQRGGSKRKRTN